MPKRGIKDLEFKKCSQDQENILFLHLVGRLLIVLKINLVIIQESFSGISMGKRIRNGD